MTSNPRNLLHRFTKKAQLLVFLHQMGGGGGGWAGDVGHRIEWLLDTLICSPVPNTALATHNGRRTHLMAAAWCIIMTLKGMDGQRPAY